VLVLTLGVLVLAATLMASTGRAAILRAAQARRDAEALQRKWAWLSVRDAALPRAERILAGVEVRTRRVTPAYLETVSLGGLVIEVGVADEQAKASVNWLIESEGRGVAESRLRGALAGTGLVNRVRLTAAVDVPPPPPASRVQPTSSALFEPPPAVVRPWVSGWGQVLEGYEPRAVIGHVVGRVSADDLLTCWGSGHINIRRAPEPALRLMLGQTLSAAEISRLVGVREALLRPGGAEVLRAAGGPEAVMRMPVRRLLAAAGVDSKPNMPPMTEVSGCHSVRVVIRDGHRSWHHLSVREQAPGETARVQTFIW
jgi:hypothetical protein